MSPSSQRRLTESVKTLKRETQRAKGHGWLGMQHLPPGGSAYPHHLIDQVRVAQLDSDRAVTALGRTESSPRRVERQRSQSRSRARAIFPSMTTAAGMTFAASMGADGAHNIRVAASSQARKWASVRRRDPGRCRGQRSLLCRQARGKSRSAIMSGSNGARALVVLGSRGSLGLTQSSCERHCPRCPGL